MSSAIEQRPEDDADAGKLAVGIEPIGESCAIKNVEGQTLGYRQILAHGLQQSYIVNGPGA
jgi:hypothetical protein